MIHATLAETKVRHSVGRPLVIDLDGSLLRSDLLIETTFSEIARSPSSVLSIAAAVPHGKAAIKAAVANLAELDPTTLPYDQAVLARIAEARAAGREVYLASASNERLVEAVAESLGVFSGWLASNDSVNLSGNAKASALIQRFGSGGFDYIGNDRADLAVWQHAATAIAVRPSSATARALRRMHPNTEWIPSEATTLATWRKQLRMHQYAKNALIFVPLLTAHAFGLISIAHAVLAAMAFSLCASGVYILNDIADLQADRAHPTKSKRPLASGKIALMHGILAVPVLLAVSLVISAIVSMSFLAVLVGYFVLTTAYSFVLKRKMMIDAVTLALLYTIRVVGGAVAINVAISEWLLAFSLLMFMSLALIKRYVELATRLDCGLPDPSNRNYKLLDLNIVAMVSAACGFNAVTVFMLYISSNSVVGLYPHPERLWLLCPILMFWLGRLLLMAHRRWVSDDPVVFALRDRVSLMVLGISGAILAAASV